MVTRVFIIFSFDPDAFPENTFPACRPWPLAPTCSKRQDEPKVHEPCCQYRQIAICNRKNAESDMNYKNIKRSNKRPLNTRNNAVKPKFHRTPTFENEHHAKGGFFQKV